MATADNDTFFATQIAQNVKEQPIIDPIKTEETSPIKETQTSLKILLTAFNSFDRNEKGVIEVSEAKTILEEQGIPIDKCKEEKYSVDVHYKVAMPTETGHIAFDEFLFVFGLCEDLSLDVEQKYDLCKKVDQRLHEFLRLLNSYRKKTETQANYKEAKKSKLKIEEIREREFERRKKFLSIIHQHEISQLEEKQQTHFEEFCKTWDQFMIDYEKTASDLIEKLQQKHEAELIEFENRTRDELTSKIRFSKQVIELEAREKNLVKLQEYEKAMEIQEEIENVKLEEMTKKQRTIEESVEARCTNLKKQQLSAVSSLLQNIQKDRNDQIKQRKQDSEKLIIRNKTLINEINHRHSDAVKKIYEALHNISLDVEKIKALKKN